VTTFHTELESSIADLGGDGPPIPGVLVVLAAGVPAFRPLVLGDAPLTLGRDDLGGQPCEDGRMSRRHARIARTRAGFVVEDLGSTNGTTLDGVRVAGSAAAQDGALLRTGNTLLLLRADLRACLHHGMRTTAGLVVGPTLSVVHEELTRAAQRTQLIMLRGESGAGKEHSAFKFYQAGPHAGGPFVPFNSAAVPSGVAERVLFGTKRGAYSGAVADAPGIIQSARGGVLFLDEIGELALDVQAKLLRFLETREVLALGATRPEHIDVPVVCATHRDLRGAVADGSFRADLYYRLAQFEVRIPPLRERREEIPWLVAHELAKLTGARLSGHASFHEECLLRPWPGNVRELLAAVRRAVVTAGDTTSLRREHLPGAAGRLLEVEAATAPRESAPQLSRDSTPSSPPPPGLSPGQLEQRERVIAALARSGSNQTAAARQLGISRKTLIERMKAFGIPRPRVDGAPS
jgi:DNA-binding NtrC family response regulator